MEFARAAARAATRPGVTGVSHVAVTRYPGFSMLDRLRICVSRTAC